MRGEDGIERDANGYAYDQYPAARIAREQAVLNMSWPQRDDKGWHARQIRSAHHADGTPWTIDVNMRLELEQDGVVVLPGRAERWNRTHVFVVVDDVRVAGPGVWLAAADVRRR